jgi:hypothetical protein
MSLINTIHYKSTVQLEIPPNQDVAIYDDRTVSADERPFSLLLDMPDLIFTHTLKFLNEREIGILAQVCHETEEKTQSIQIFC